MNLFELFVKIGVNDQASKNISNITQKLGNGLKTAAKIGTAAVGVASAAIVGLTKQSIESYAEYEQLVGGAELMFGNAFDFVKQKSQEAYKTVQMSQNEYLTQVNGFATGLKTALGGNEQAAAQLADRIVTAEADIIAATGNAAENVQNAFNGIMRSNFTMLDNLQIGITPTKEGFQEVIDKVNEWNATNGKATKYQMGNLADMQNALVDYIDMVGYSGYANAEASKTIQGSLASAKGAYHNLLTGIADDNADFGTLVTNFVDSVGTVAENILPRVETALTGVGDLVDTLFPTIIDKIPAIIESVLPKLATSAINIVNSLINGISENQEVIVSTALSVVTTLINGILGALPQLASVAMTLVATLATGLAENLDGLIPTVVSVIAEIANTLTNLDNVRPITLAAIELILVLVEGIMEALPTLIDAILLVGENITATLLDPQILAKIINAALRIVIALAGGLIASTPRLLTSVITLVEVIINTIVNADWGKAAKNVVDGLLDGLKKAWGSIKTWFTNAWNNLFGNKSVDVSANVIGGDVDGSHAGGLDYVPFDGYVAELHKGEQVLTAEEARDYKRGGKVVSVVQNIYSQAKTAADLMQEAKYQQERAVLFGV
jgi:phage-related protein